MLRSGQPVRFGNLRCNALYSIYEFRSSHPFNSMTEDSFGLISFVIPEKDEEESLKELYERIALEMGKLKRPFEIVFIDDGSVDGSWKVISELAADHPDEVIACRFRKNV